MTKLVEIYALINISGNYKDYYLIALIMKMLSVDPQ